MWFQRSKAKWINDGDRNTRYYHLKAINRRRKNKILMLHDSKGILVEEEEQLRGMVNNFYQDIFRAEAGDRDYIVTRYSFPQLELQVSLDLGKEIDDTKVKTVLFSMGTWKSHGSDGFPAGFYQ